MKKYMAVDFGGTFIKLGIVDQEATILQSEKVKTPNNLEKLLTVIGDFLESNKGVSGIAISSPGAVSDEGIIHGSSAIPYIHGFKIKKLIQERFHLPVNIENDANSVAYAEMWVGEAKDIQDFLVMVIGTGIGGAVINNGKLHKGANLHGGEFGYMLLTTDFQSSDDVWSRLASTKALVRKVAEKKQMNPDNLSGEAVFRMADSGDKICKEAVDRFYHLLAVGIYNLQYIYDPEVILIGGGISEKEDLMDQINQKLDRILSLIDLAKVKPNIRTCKHRQHANLLGAVYGFMKANS